MIEAKPTPGPWWIDRPHKESYVQLIRANGPGGNRAAIANIYTYRGIEQAAADARLIAAAPELLHAAKMAQETIGWITDASKERYVKETLQKAIEKAEGSA